MAARPNRKFLYVAVFMASSTMWAQTPYLAKGNQELNAFGGFSYGLDHWRGSYGANYAIAPFDKYVMLYGEYSYFPGVARQTGPVLVDNIQVATSATTTSRFQDLHAGVHIRLPIFPEKRIVPYVSAGFGWLQDEPNGTFHTQQGSVTLPVVTANHAAINAGGGFRFYLTGDGRFGLRLEAKTYKPFGTGSSLIAVHPDAFGKVSLGVFYQFK